MCRVTGLGFRVSDLGLCTLFVIGADDLYDADDHNRVDPEGRVEDVEVAGPAFGELGGFQLLGLTFRVEVLRVPLPSEQGTP